MLTPPRVGLDVQIRSRVRAGWHTYRNRPLVARRPPTPAEREDTEYRRAYGTNGRAPWGHPLRAAFYTELPEAPPNARSRDDAAVYLAHIRRVLDMECWTPRERDRLKVLERRWDKRAKGLDPRYVQFGTRGGRTLAQMQNARPGSAQAVYAACIREVEESARKTKDHGRQAKFVTDPKWPLGKPNPDRRA